MSLEPGFYNNISMSDYHKDPALSRSDILMFRDNPLKFKVQKQLLKKEVDHFAIGTAGHAAILQPETYWSNVAVAPSSVLGKSGSRNTNKYKKWAAEPGRKGKALITQDQAAIVRGMVESVYENPKHSTARAILKSANIIIEQTIVFLDATANFKCKIRPDVRLSQHLALVDVKTSQNASKESFSRDCARYGYDVQAAFYLTGASRATLRDYQTFIFIVIEKEPPYCVAVYKADQEMLDAGRRKIRPIIKLYSECLTAGTWPSYQDEISDLSLPRWAL